MRRDKNVKAKANVIIPTNMRNPPEQHEIEVAWIISEYFNCEVIFLKPVDAYKTKTADIKMNGIEWEIKSPIGKSTKTIGKKLKQASSQSKYIIFDSRRSPIADDIIENKIKYELTEHRSLKRVIMVKKDKKVIDILTAK
jgi:hypothetical protein